MTDIVAKMTALTHGLHVFGVRAFDWLTRASVLPEMGDGQYYYRPMTAIPAVPETESELAV